MEQQQTSISDKQKEIIRLTQFIINCDDYIMKYANYPDVVDLWQQRKERAEYELQDLETDEFI